MHARVKTASPARRAVNVSVSSALVEEARERKLNLSRVLEEALETLLRTERARRWQEENREALACHRERIERDGMWNKDLVSF